MGPKGNTFMMYLNVGKITLNIQEFTNARSNLECTLKTKL